MCGIAGFLETARHLPAPALSSLARAMGDRLVHRGPDDAGAWVEADAGLALAHRRLAIVDLTPLGHQPMVSADGRFVVVFNGEIYDHPSTRETLQARGHVFRGRSDTEVLLAAVTEWGVERAVTRFNGMFAFALWDRTERKLHLVRDRLGEKPLYYAWSGGTFLFGSELKALRAHPHFPAAISREALTLYARYGYIPAPYTIHEGVAKLAPGVLLTIDPARAGESTSRTYWSIEEAMARGEADPWRGSEDEAVEALDALLRDSVRMRLQADVPVGVFLSGGIDSSTVAALAQAESGGATARTFTIGFREERFDEAASARAVAAHLGTHHTELSLSGEDALAVVPLLSTVYDEPFADSSQIPTFLVARLARTEVTVCLSGDGGDELFGGYGRYVLARGLWGAFSRVPRPVRAWVAAAMARTPGAMDAAGAAIAAVRRLSFRSVPLSAAAADQGRRLSRLLGAAGPDLLYRDLLSAWPDPERLVVGGREPGSALTQAQAVPSRRPLIEQMMGWDLVSYLPDDILAKVDRASMAVSLEGRIPLLDHRVVELAQRLPLGLKIRGDVGKHLLRRVLHRYVPPALVERPKRGFAIPVDAWLRGPLREWARDLLAEERLRREGFLDPAAVSTALREHLAGASRGAQLWVALMFQSWLEAQQARPSSHPAAAAPLRGVVAVTS
jgi:asparagine synthase (glutamine-hydrolysing)